MTREGLKKRGERREREREIFFIIKIIYLVATVLPNVLGSTVTTQALSPKIWQLLWLVFL
jgi:hypothetical protein